MQSVQSKALGQLGREEEHVHTLLKNTRPKASYTEAMRACFEWHGSTYNIATCNVDILRAWLRSACAAGSLCSAKRADILDVLDDETGVDLLSRWYAVDSALIYKVIEMREGAILVPVATDKKPVPQEKREDTPTMATQPRTQKLTPAAEKEVKRRIEKRISRSAPAHKTAVRRATKRG